MVYVKSQPINNLQRFPSSMVRLLPQLVICHSCSFALYEGADLKPPYEIVEGYEGRCPKCGEKLSSIPESIEIRIFDAPNAPSAYTRGD